MRFVIWIGTEHPWPDVAETARAADAAGWDSIYLADHFMPNEEPPGLGPRLEAWTAIGALAAITERARLGVLVSGNTYRHPAILANMAATTDRISQGRLVLGLGAGWQVNEHAAYGIDLYEIPERLARLEEACDVVRLLLREERSNFEGRYYRLADAPCEPKPLQARLPLLLGTSGERVGMKIAARHADIWNCWGTPETMAHKLSVLDAHCEAISRDPATLQRSTQALLRITEDRSELSEWRTRPHAMATLVGTPSEVGEQLAAYDSLGIDEFVVVERALGSEHSARLENMAAFLEGPAAPFRA
ncbi:MAG: TIGR03560 family F420-dependent LLM class oxidoreductase [Acidimicrobiales bacterium]